MGVNSISGSAGSNTVVVTASNIRANAVSTNSRSPQNTQDTVKLSVTALVKSLKLQGQSPSQIAQQLGIKVATVDSYLGIKPAAPLTGQTAKSIPPEPCWITDIVSSTFAQ